MLKSLQKHTNKKGFTLVELVIVIAIIAILAAVAIPTITGIVDSANRNVDQTNAQQIESTIKTALTEIQSGQWTPGGSTTAANLTVAQALEHQGLQASMLTSLRSGTGYVFANGKVYPNNATPSGVTGTALTAATVCATVVGP